MRIMEGKKGIVFGLANHRSIAAGIIKLLHAQGAEVAIAYQGELLKKRVLPIAQEVESPLVISCDVTKKGDIHKVFETLEQKWGEIDFVVHSLAYADRDALQGEYLTISLEQFQHSLHVSCYSFVEMCQCAKALMKPEGSLLTLTYYGSQKVVPNYNLMGVAKAALEASVRYLAVDLGKRGVRVNALSAGPIKTLASSGIKGFSKMLSYDAALSPLGRNTTVKDVAGGALYLLSSIGGGVTGQVSYVDCGTSVVCLPSES